MKYLHTMVRVTDLAASLRFYCDGLGLVEVKRTEHETGRFTLVFLAAPQDRKRAEQARQAGLELDIPMMELTHNWDPEQYAGGRNFGHLAYGTEDIYALCEHLQTMGVAIRRPPRDGRMAFVRSPDEISVELLQQGPPLPPREPWLSMPNSGVW